jgi:UTP-glucose-1-phosphate uridylyltransferase
MLPTLLVLAAGMGSRYGGLKQIEPVGPSGETLLDYSVFDASRAGFDRVVFVIRRDFEAIFREKIGAKYSNRIAVDYAFQASDDLPAGCILPGPREKPLGTGHATWCARNIVHAPFAVINADDFYGADAFRRLAAFLATSQAGEAAMAGFQLVRTLSENGAVSRGICDVANDGTLHSVVECTGIPATEVGAGKKFSGAEIVSMNCWGFHPDIFLQLENLLREFLLGTPPEKLDKAEFYLPASVSTLIARGILRTRVLPAGGDWFGVTYREDKPRVAAALSSLVQAGTYPAKLF